MEWVLASHVRKHLVPSLARERFRQHLLRYILSPRWHGMGLVNTCFETFCFLADMGGVCSTHVEKHFVSSLVRDGFVQHMLR